MRSLAEFDELYNSFNVDSLITARKVGNLMALL